MAETSSSETPTESVQSATTSDGVKQVPDIPIEIISEEEMALIETAFSLALASSSRASSSSLSTFSSSCSSRPIKSISVLSKRRLSSCTTEMKNSVDIEDGVGNQNNKRVRGARDSFLHLFRKNRALAVTDITATEWCEKQMEFVLLRGKQKATKAMVAGTIRHSELEKEVIKRVKVRVKSAEDIWALKFMNFIVGAQQLVCDGLTRELPVIGFVEGVWMTGVIDEIRMTVTGSDNSPTLIDTKTRVRDTLPAEPQRRNGRLQLMCYKYLWDSLVTDNFPSTQFFDFFSLNRYNTLCEEIQESTTTSGYPAKTLDDVIRSFKNTCSMLLPADDKLLLRYESQHDRSLIGEENFEYDPEWVKSQIHSCFEFWQGKREAKYTPEEERWKCRHCSFASVCLVNADSSSSDQIVKQHKN